MSQSKDEKEDLINGYEHEIDRLRSLKKEHEWQLKETKRNIHDLTLKQDELTHSIREKDEQIKQLKIELERVNNISIVQRLLGKK